MEVGIIVPVRNRASIVERALHSIASQTYRPLRLTLVDNGSTDGTMDALLKFQRERQGDGLSIEVLGEPRVGATAARNAGLRATPSQWVMFFDSDDTMDACLVERYMDRIGQCGDDVDIVVTRCDLTTPGGKRRPLPYFESGDPMKYHLIDAILSTQRYITRRSLVERAGGWDEDLPRWNDWELGVRLLLQRPRVAYLGGRIMVHTYFTPVSITGTSRLSHCGEWEKSLDAVEADLRASDCPGKERYLKYVDYRRVLLAGEYAREGGSDASRALYASTREKTCRARTLRWLLPMLYRYISIGGKGASRIAKAVIR